MKKINPEKEHGLVHRYEPNTIFKYNGWPSVCRDERGVLYAVASSMRLSHVDPTGKTCMWMSFDQGKSWTPSVVVNDSYFDDRDAGIISRGDGKMLLTWFSLCYPDFCDPIQNYEWFGVPEKAICKGYGEMWRTLSDDVRRAGHGAFVRVSDDYGMTWSEAIKVPLTAPHGASVCRDGTLIYMGKEMKNDYIAPAPIVFYTSSDGGYTWDYTGTVPVGDDCTVENMHEPHVIELEDGTLLGAIRVHERKKAPYNTVYITTSNDRGKTWSKPRCIGVDGLPPHLMRHSSGAIICSYACRADGMRSERAAVSYDNGKTWTEDYCIDDRIDKQLDMGYPASVELSDGSILTVYYQCAPGDWYTSVMWTKWKLHK